MKTQHKRNNILKQKNLLTFITVITAIGNTTALLIQCPIGITGQADTITGTCCTSGWTL